MVLTPEDPAFPFIHLLDIVWTFEGDPADFNESTGAENPFRWTVTLPQIISNPDDVPLTGITIVTNLPRRLGDVSGNGHIGEFDAHLIARHLVGQTGLDEFCNCHDDDCPCLGFELEYGMVTPGSVALDSVRLVDATMILRVAAGDPDVVLGEYPAS